MHLLATILEEAAAKGISQKSLAAGACIAGESLSRMKGKAAVRSDTLEQLAQGVGLRLALLPLEEKGRPRVLKTPLAAAPDRPGAAGGKAGFREKYRALVWSNPQASAEVFVRQALLKPDFSVLLDAATEFGLGFVDRQWALLQAEGSQEAVRAAPATQRMLRNMHHGHEQAAA